MPPELHDCLSELRRQLVDLLQVEAECLRKALEISRTAGQGPEFDAAMRRVDATRTARGEIVKRIHQLEGREAGRPLPDPHVPSELPDPAMLAAAGARGGRVTPHSHR